MCCSVWFLASWFFIGSYALAGPQDKTPQSPLVACSHGNQISAESKALTADLEKQIPRLMEEAKVPGLSIAIIKDGKLFWRRGFGVKDVTSQEPVDNDT